MRKKEKYSNFTEDFANAAYISIALVSAGVIYVGNPNILKQFCPGIYGTIKPIGICMIGAK